MKHLLLILILALTAMPLSAQDNVDYMSQRKYRIGDVSVEGANTLDDNAIILISELGRGDEISVPGTEITDAIRKLWDQKLFSDVQILQKKVSGEYIFLVIKVAELPRLRGFNFPGDVTKGEAEKIREIINLYEGKIVNESLKKVTAQHIRNFYIDKGFLKVKVNVTQDLDTTRNNYVRLHFNVTKGKKFKINDIVLHGNESIKSGKIYRNMKETKRKKWWRVWKRSKFMRTPYETDKQTVVSLYNEIGLRDAIIRTDTVYDYDDKSVNIELHIDEGKRYYFGDFSWVGNTKYSAGRLDTILGIKRGDVYNQAQLESRFYFSQNGTDITSLYMDRGHLFFQLDPREMIEVGDSNFINYEVRMNEGKVAYIRDVRVYGNTKTNDHVIYREIRTRPGDRFSRNEIIRTQRELNNLGYFDPEQMDVQPIPNPIDGTVDIEYKVTEKPSDQVELSGGWGGGRIVGTLGLVFNNFSLRKLFKRGAWQPLPTGDGQRLSIRAQSNGLWYQSYNFSFTEPWLGGKKPNSLTVSAYHSILSNGERRNSEARQDLKVTGGAVGLGWRNKFPDDFFTSYIEGGYQRYNVNNYGSLFALDSGIAHSVHIRFQLSRNSVDQPLYPTSGSAFKASVKVGLPFNTLLNGDKIDFTDATPQERYQWVEYIKPKFTASWFTSLSKSKAKHKLVLNTRVGFSALMPWNSDIGVPPFERFYLGGSGLTGFNNLDGREIIALRGYDNQWLSSAQGSAIISKYTVELRYPISLNPSATIYALAFGEAGSTWDSWEDFNPFEVKRSAGIGLRIFLPMFGLMGLDYGWGFDAPDQNHTGFTPFLNEVNSSKFNFRGQFHFTIGMNLGEL